MKHIIENKSINNNYKKGKHKQYTDAMNNHKKG